MAASTTKPNCVFSAVPSAEDETPRDLNSVKPHELQCGGRSLVKALRLLAAPMVRSLSEALGLSDECRVVTMAVPPYTIMHTNKGTLRPAQTPFLRRSVSLRSGWAVSLRAECELCVDPG
jgi:hypothetical protein